MSDDNADTQTPPHLPLAGWYPDPHEGSAQRYWDGAQWTEHTAAPDAEAVPAAVSARRGLPKLRWWQWALAGFGVLVLVSIIAGAINGGRASTVAQPAQSAAGAASQSATPSAKPLEMVDVPNLVGSTVAEARAALAAVGLALAAGDAGDDWVITAQQPAKGSHPAVGLELRVTSQAPKPVYTREQENALKQARSYLKFSAFSRQGLIDQLSSQYGSGYPVDVATWAADTVAADWNAEAVEAAQSYLKVSSFSRDGLFEQLTSQYGSQFTPDQANFALAAIGY